MAKGSDFKVDKKKCIGCGTCFVTELFHFGSDGKSEPIAAAENEEYSIDQVIAICPQGAISQKK